MPPEHKTSCFIGKGSLGPENSKKTWPASSEGVLFLKIESRISEIMYIVLVYTHTHIYIYIYIYMYIYTDCSPVALYTHSFRFKIPLSRCNLISKARVEQQALCVQHEYKVRRTNCQYVCIYIYMYICFLSTVAIFIWLETFHIWLPISSCNRQQSLQSAMTPCEFTRIGHLRPLKK